MQKIWKYFNQSLVLSCVILSFTSSDIVSANNGEKRNFTLTGYYSPLPNQNFYVTGSYEAEIRLNGKGIRGADGTPVFPGMIAAPSNYSFGTKICLPDFGCGEIHDRGGAIVNKGERSLARHDRLDLWLGYGEEGLLRALALGVDHVEGTMYTANSPVDVAVNFQAVTPLNKILDLPDKIKFKENLYTGSNKNELIKKLQESLLELGFYNNEITGSFEKKTKEAVFAFQKKNFIVENITDYGAGSFGPMTREKLSGILYKKSVQKAITEKWAEFHFEENFQRGQRSADVLRLQEVLIQEELMNHQPTGYFGKITKEALIEFQIAHDIIKNRNNRGAGNVGPKTREYLNKILEIKKEENSTESSLILAYQKNEQKMQYFAGKLSNNNLVQK